MTQRKALRVRNYIEHIIIAITRIESYVEGMDRAAFIKSSLVQDAVIRNFEIIGEAANKIRTVDPGFAQQHPGLRLELAYAMRNMLAHGYDSVNLSTVWNTIHGDLPVMKRQMTQILLALKEEREGAHCAAIFPAAFPRGSGPERTLTNFSAPRALRGQVRGPQKSGQDARKNRLSLSRQSGRSGAAAKPQFRRSRATATFRPCQAALKSQQSVPSGQRAVRSLPARQTFCTRRSGATPAKTYLESDRRG